MLLNDVPHSRVP